jgi:hypothetical protein
VFAVSFSLLIMGLLGDTRSTVLETEAQLLVLCAVGLYGHSNLVLERVVVWT